MDIIKNNLLIIIFVAVAIIFFVWFGMSDTVSNSNLLVADRTEDISAADQEILKLLLDMRSIQLDSGIFENPAFASLRDFGRSIVAEPVGRENPFVPLRVNVVQQNVQRGGVEEVPPQQDANGL